MKRVIVAVIGTVWGLVALLSFKTHDLASTTGVAASDGTNSAGSVSRSGTSSTTASRSAPKGTPSAKSTVKATKTPKATSTPKATTEAVTTRTVAGPTVETRWGPIQVQVTVQGSKLTDVTVLQQPSENFRDQQINGFALPVLTREALAAQSADIDTVSGATLTSEGYISSLQSALDQARA